MIRSVLTVDNSLLIIYFFGPNSKPSVTNPGVGAVIGYQWIFNNNITLEVGGGPVYSVVLVNVEDDTFDEDFDGILPKFSFTVGYARSKFKN